MTTEGVDRDYVPFDNASNPAIKGYYADPEVMYAEQTKRYYIYPTSDGFDGWSGHYFKTFSSSDLQHWKDEGKILDLRSDIRWANDYAWAPCIIERPYTSGKGRKRTTTYKYFYYYSANKQIGVAVADRPEGPFKDPIGKPLVNHHPKGQTWGQEIDPDVFFDPQSGKYFLYWGNGYMAGVELHDDMTSFDADSVKLLTPCRSYNEGTYVFFRQGTYYFLWSENDTRSEDYRVCYGMASSPLGPIRIPKNNCILSKRSDKGIYGTGHNSVIQLPGTDEWRIVYQRSENGRRRSWLQPRSMHRQDALQRRRHHPSSRAYAVAPTCGSHPNISDEDLIWRFILNFIKVLTTSYSHLPRTRKQITHL